MPIFKGEFYLWVSNIANGGMGLMGLMGVGLMGFALIFCYGYWCICRFMVVVVGDCFGGGRDGFIMGL